VSESRVILEVKGLKKYFPVHRGDKTLFVKAIDGIDFEVREGETVGLVGESGSGKSTTAYCVIGMYSVTDGTIVFKGKDISCASVQRPLELKRDMQIVFQDPMSSLNPRMTVGQMLSEPLLFHGIAQNIDEAIEIVKNLLTQVGLKPYHIDRYPHQFSGGQRQRIAIARAVSVNPELIVLDEPTSALDVSVQAQIVKLLKELQEKLNAGYVFISHDLALVRFISDEVAVMYLGKIVEKGGSEEVFDNPLHPYTKALLAAAPIPDPKKKRNRKELIGGQVPSPINRPSGCFFHPRCKYKMEICSKEYPPLFKVSDNHYVACHLYSTSSKEGGEKA